MEAKLRPTSHIITLLSGLLDSLSISRPHSDKDVYSTILGLFNGLQKSDMSTSLYTDFDCPYHLNLDSDYSSALIFPHQIIHYNSR